MDNEESDGLIRMESYDDEISSARQSSECKNLNVTVFDRGNLQGFRIKLNNYTTTNPNSNLVDLKRARMEM